MIKKIVIILLIIALAAGAIFYFTIRRITARQQALPNVAIVIDDWGYNLKNKAFLNSIDVPVTIAVLPNLKYSFAAAECGRENRNVEVILHMPMEPENKNVRLEKDTLLVAMDNKKASRLLGKALDALPNAKGVSNHMGSKATQNPRLMTALMEELKRRKMYFLDSYATPDSVCQEQAKKIKLRFAKRDVFLDNKADKKYIALQFDELIALAKARGHAIGIGHDRPLTLKVIKDKVQKLHNKEVRFVFVSKLAK